ncbi:MAG: MopE-related protein, partial [Saprospiraceae bacterium]
FYADTDDDGYGDESNSIDACTAPEGYVSDNTDCDDGNAAVNPGATEVCNGIDDDCDGLTDDSDPGIVGQTTYYADADGDGYGDEEVSVQSCNLPEGYVTDDTDCDDNDGDVHPGATEVCNDKDDDCDGAIDEELQSTFYADTDDDGYGDESNSIDACTAPEGYVSDDTDCDDGNGAINPGATEICGDEIDNNCDGVVDEGCVISYCASSGSGAPGNKFIKQIKMQKVSNNTTVLNNLSNNNNGYGNYTAINTNVDANAAYKLTLYPSIIVGVPVSFAWKVWIDYNRDGDFNDAGENVATASANGNVSPANIVIPNGAVQGQGLRMRVSMKLGTVPITYNGPCDNGFNGEVEDYTITVNGGILRVKSSKTGLTRSVDNQLQIAESNDLDFEIFPNPTKGKVYINCTGNFDGMATAYIHDLQGRRIHQQLVNMSLGHKLEIDVPSLQSGTYAVTIVNADNQIQTQLLEVRN